MNFLNSLIHGDALAQILMEGHNPDALQKLATADIDALRQAMQTGESLHLALQARGVASQFEDKQADSPFWRSSEAAAQDCLQGA